MLYICHDDLQEQNGTIGNVFEGRPKESSLFEKEGNLLFACIFCLLGKCVPSSIDVLTLQHMKIPGLVISTVVNVYGTDDIFTFIATCVACTLLPLDGFLDALIYGADELRLLKLCRWIRRKMCLGSSKGYKKKRLGEVDGGNEDYADLRRSHTESAIEGQTVYPED